MAALAGAYRPQRAAVPYPLAKPVCQRQRGRIAPVRLSSLACRAWLVLVATRASAAPPEILSQLALHPTDPSRIVLAYAQGGQGLLFSNDGGLSFRLRCGAAVSESFTKSRAPLLLAEDGETLLGTFEGLVRGGSDGCNFRDDVGMAGLQVADFAPHPTDPSIAFVATANPSDGRATGLIRRGSDGTFTRLGASDTGSDGSPSMAMNRLGVAPLPDAGLRFYASALLGDGAGNYRPILRHSDDEGATWTSHEVPGADGARVLLIGVDPTNPDRVAIALQREGANDSVLVSADAGLSFEARIELFELGASSVAPDGRLWVGDAGGEVEYSQPGGLYLLDDFSAPARKLATWPVRCLGYRAIDDRLFACQRSAFGDVDPESGVFSRLSSLETVGGFVACGDEALARTCQAQLCDNWCGVLHYASAPLCDAYSEVNPLCGPAARGYGQGNPAVGAGGMSGLGLPGDEPPPPPESNVDAGAAGAAPGAQAAHQAGACRIGAPSTSAPLTLTLGNLWPALGLWLRRAQRRRPERRRANGSCSGPHGTCNPHRPRRH